MLFPQRLFQPVFESPQPACLEFDHANKEGVPNAGTPFESSLLKRSVYVNADPDITPLAGATTAG